MSPNEYFTMVASATDWSGDTIRITIVDNDGTPVVPLKPPTGLTIVPGPNALYLSWTAPVDADRTGWEVRYRQLGGSWGDWSTVSGGASATSHTITGLSRASYEVQLRATGASGRESNAVQKGSLTNSGVTDNGGSGIAVDEGGAFTYGIKLTSRGAANVVVTPASTNSDLSFNPTTVTFSPSNWNEFQNITVSAARDTDANDENTHITYTATNYGTISRRTSVRIFDTGTTTGGDIGPAQPTNVRATAGNQQVTLTWTKPPGTITGYEVRYAKSGSPWGDWTAIPRLWSHYGEPYGDWIGWGLAI